MKGCSRRKRGCLGGCWTFGRKRRKKPAAASVFGAEEKRKEAASEKADKTRGETGRTYRDTLKDYGIEEDDDTIIITASSVEELERLVNDYFYNQRSNQVMTPQEKMVGQNMDFRL